MKSRYGLIGLFSIVGVMGVVTQNTSLYPFLAFVVFFEYLFVEPDEMFVENMRKAASWAFYTQLAIVALITCASIVPFPETALQKGAAAGFGIALVVFCLTTAYFDWKDRRGVLND